MMPPFSGFKEWHAKLIIGLVAIGGLSGIIWLIMGIIWLINNIQIF